MLDETSWTKNTRYIAAVGLLAYLASFFFLGSRHTFFYVLVALPAIPLFMNLPRMLTDGDRLPVSLVLAFVGYFALSSLWSSEGRLFDGARQALGVVGLMVVVHSTMSLCSDSGARIRRFTLIAGACAAALYCALFIGKGLASGEFADILSPRYTLRLLSGFGDNNPINTAIYFGVVAIAAWWSFPRSRPWTKFGLMLVVGACVVLMFLTKSRGPILSLIVALFTLSLARRHRDDLLLWAIAASAGIAAILGFDLVSTILDRAGSPNYRAAIWLNAIESIKGNLFFGQGLGTSADIPFMAEENVVVTVGHSHSTILETFRVGGLLGGGLFVAMVLSVGRRSLARNPECCFFVLWLLYGLLCLSTNGRLPLRRPSIEWFALWVPLFFALFTPTGIAAERLSVRVY